MKEETLNIADLLEEVRAARLPSENRRRNLRQAAGLSLRDVAAALGVDPMTIYRWEHGVTPKRPHARAYRELLDGLEEVLAK